MANLSQSLKLPAEQASRGELYLGGLGFDRAMALLGLWLLGGLFIDGWAHEHVGDLETFFTPWHAIMYSGLLANGATLGLVALRNRARGAGWRQALPAGYGLSALGMVLFGLGGVADLVWHELFGIEQDTAALLSPSHLLLALSGVLILGGPLRAAWSRPDRPGQGRWASQLPLLISLTLLVSLLSFFTQFASPIRDMTAIEPLRDTGMPVDIYSMRPDGSLQSRLTSNATGWTYYPAISPDGRHVAFTASAGQTSTIEVMAVDGSGRRPLTSPDSGSWYPAWSPDSQQIAFSSERDGQAAIYVMRADGSQQRKLSQSLGSDFDPAWSPDGSQIAFASERDGNREIYLMRADGSQPIRLTSDPAQDSQPVWSPDGSQIAFVSTRDGAQALYLMRRDGSQQRQLSSTALSGWGASWSADGQSLITSFYDRELDSSELYRVEVATGATTRLTNNPALEERGRISSSSDGLTLVFTGYGHAWVTPGYHMSMGVAGVLIYTALLVGLLLLAMRRWELAPGAVTLVLVINVALMALMQDTYQLIAVALLAGLLADLLRWRLRVAPGRVGATRVFSFCLPALFFTGYFAALQLQRPISWEVHLWAGSIVMAGFTGLLLSFLLYPPTDDRQRTPGHG